MKKEKKTKRLLLYSVLLLTVFCIYFLSNTLEINNNHWTQQLPQCPCNAPGNSLNDGWAKDPGDMNRFHNGAVEGYRSYPATKTEEGMSGQQCCYDKNGKLLTTGRGAGTPDRSSTCKGEDENGMMIVDYQGVIKHVYKDVFPFFVLEIENYQKIWTPDKGENCNN